MVPLFVAGLFVIVASHDSSISEVSEVSLWDDSFQNRECLETMINDGVVSLEDACSDDKSNRIKDDRGNLIRLTRWEDRVGYMIYEGVMRDCRQGLPFVRDMVASWAEAASCFETEDTLMGNEKTHPEWYVDNKITVKKDGVEVIELTGTKTKRVCEDTGRQVKDKSDLMRKQAALVELIDKFDRAVGAKEDLHGICKDLFAAGNDPKFVVYELLDMTRPAACKDETSQVCKDVTNWLVEFLNRDLFTVSGGGSGKKGRDNGANEHYEKCKHIELEYEEDEKPSVKGGHANHDLNKYTRKTHTAGITVAYPDCTLDGLKGRLWGDDGVNCGKFKFGPSNDMIADAFRNCSVPFIGGPSGTIPKYIAWAAAGPSRTEFRGLPDKELLMLLASIELGGHHSWTEMIFAMNHYLGTMKVTPPFDSGESDGKLNVYDKCVTEGDSSGAYSDAAYSKMMSQFEAFVKVTFQLDSTASADDNITTEAKAYRKSSLIASMLGALFLAVSCIICYLEICGNGKK